MFDSCYKLINYLFDPLIQYVYFPIRSFLSLLSLRKILFYLILLLFIFSISLTAYSIYLTQLFYDPHYLSNATNWFAISCIGLALTIISGVGLKGAHSVNLDLLFVYFWGITVFIAPLVLGIIACFDFYVFASMWFTHSWAFPSFAGVRDIFCYPVSTADNKCNAPFQGGVDYVSVDAWCLDKYNSIDCADIKQDAIHSAVDWGEKLALSQAFVSCGMLVVIVASIYICSRILTTPVITESMNDVINYLLLVPIVLCIIMGLYLWDWESYTTLPYVWIPILFISVAVCQIVSLPLGIMSGRLKSLKLNTLYIFLIFSCAAALVVGGLVGVTYAELLDVEYHPSEQEVSDIACFRQFSGCCCCDDEDLDIQCPEWSESEVLDLIKLDFKIAGTVSFLCVFYLIGSLLVVSLVRKSLKNYKTDYI